MTKTKDFLRFLICSIIGIVYFFVPVIDGLTPMVFIINQASALFSGVLPALALLSSAALIVLSIIPKVTDRYPTITRLYGSAKIWSIVIYCLGLMVGLMVYFNLGPAVIYDSGIGGQALKSASGIIPTVLLAGIMVPFIAEYGLLELIGAIIEPLMRPLFHVPGCAAIDAVTSFVANPTVGIFFTNKLYKNKTYTKREACAIATNFSIISLGFFAVMANLSNVMDHYGAVVLTSFLLSFVVAVIMIRIPPLRWTPNVYHDGTQPEPETEKAAEGSFFSRCCKAAVDKAASVKSAPLFQKYLLDVTVFTQKLVPFMLFVCTIALFLAKHTMFFNYLGLPFTPLLKLLQIPCAEEIAPAMVIGMAEVSLPCVFISDLAIPAASGFFVTIIAALQIIALAGSFPSILESDLPLGPVKLIVIFFLRTLVSIPLAAAVTHLLF